MEELAETPNVDACVRFVCREPHTTNPDATVRTLPGTAVVDGGLVAGLATVLRAKARDLDAAVRELYVEERGRAAGARSSQVAIERSAREIQASLDGLQESLARLGSDVEVSSKRLEELYGKLDRVREAKEVVEEGLRTLERAEEASRMLEFEEDEEEGEENGENSHGDGVRNRSEVPMNARVYHAARLYAQCMRDVKSRQSKQARALPALLRRVEALKPLLDARVVGLVNGFLGEQHQKSTEIGRDAMAGRRIASGRYGLDALSWAVVVTKAYQAYGGDVGRVREMYVAHREEQLGRVLEGTDSWRGVEDSRREPRAVLHLDEIVGFFLMEMAVTEVLDTREFLKTMWDGVRAAVGAEVGAACDECDGCDGWRDMLRMKEDVLRAVRALKFASGNVTAVSLETGSLVSSLAKRTTRFERLVGAAFVMELEAIETAAGDENAGEEDAGADVVEIDMAVRACCERVEGWMEGLGEADRERERDMERVDAVLADVLGGLVEKMFKQEGDETNSGETIAGLLSFVETVAYVLRSLEGVYAASCGRSTLRLHDLVEREATRAGVMLAEKTFADAMEVRGADGDDSGGDLLSSWSDALIEQFEFTRDELFGEYEGFGLDVATSVVAAYASEARRLVAGLDGTTKKDVDAVFEVLDGATRV